MSEQSVIESTAEERKLLRDAADDFFATTSYEPAPSDLKVEDEADVQDD